jgi:FAD/FMN-containing dehydrogenase
VTIAPAPADWVGSLSAQVRGEVIAPGHPGYDGARMLFSGSFDRHPGAVVRVVDSADAARVVTFAREAGLPLAVRSGGHSGAGHSVCDDGVVLDLGRMRGLDIDVDAGTAWAQTGATAGEYTAAAGEHGLVTGFGDTGSVGIGGITLGGGIGFLVRKYGLTIDDLVAAEMVTADGELLHVHADEHPDLFWAIRGGGGNFGVATRLKFRLHRLDRVVGGMLILPATAETVTAFVAAAEAAPEELSTIANVMPAPPMPFLDAEHHGQLVILALMCFAGPAEAGEPALAPFRALAPPLADLVEEVPYPSLYGPDEVDADYHPLAVGRTMFLDHVDLDTAGTVMEYLRASDAPLRVAQLRVLGGAMARVDPDATAFAHRRSRIMANVAAFHGPDDRPQRDAWVGEFAAALRQRDAGVYVNFLGPEGRDAIRAAYPGATWDRLVEVKRRYDPTNLFRLNQNIAP